MHGQLVALVLVSRPQIASPFSSVSGPASTPGGMQQSLSTLSCVLFLSTQALHTEKGFGVVDGGVCWDNKGRGIHPSITTRIIFL